jgi:hypothetical protein
MQDPCDRSLRPNVSGATVRDASEDDAPACAAIYALYVRETAVSFEGEPPTPAQMAERIAAAMSTHAWVVHEEDHRVVGYAYGGPHQKRAAYRFSCEVSVYVEQGRRRTGSGSSRSASTGGSAGSSARGTTSRGCSGRSASSTTLPPSRAEATARVFERREDALCDPRHGGI